MTKFIYSCCGFTAPHIGVIIDEVVSCINHGDKVCWGFCHGALSSCWSNRNGKKGACALCHRMYKEYSSIFSAKVKMIPIRSSDISHPKQQLTFTCPQEVREFEYKGVKVGLSVLSTYYTFTRDLDINDFDSFKDYCIPLIKDICALIDYISSVINDIKPDEIVTINGRHFSNRFLYDICQNRHIQFKSLEVIGGSGDAPFKKVSFKNALPHSIMLNNNKIEELWKISTDSPEKRREIADAFYVKRRNGELIADVKSYVASQEKGLLPNGFDENQHNIAIFNSSADEFAAIGGEWDENLLFASQYDAIKYILENSPSGCHYYLRIHPNLEGVNHKAHMDLYKLSSYDNITVISPSEKISTYSLMSKCDTIVTFGSTMGVEACYWGKPSILIGHCAYEKQDVSYIPETREELVKLLGETTLPAKPIDGAIKYAYYLLDDRFMIEPTTIDIGIHYHKIGICFSCTDYLKLHGKTWLYQLAHLLFVRIPSRK